MWHSGWPGTFKEMMKSGLDKMKEIYKTNLKDVLMGLGIGMQQKYYEVGIEFYEKFSDKFGKESEFIKKSFCWNENTKKYHFDNTKFNEIMALKLGILKENLIISNEDTFDPRFHSYRREGKMSGRATAMISFI